MLFTYGWMPVRFNANKECRKNWEIGDSNDLCTIFVTLIYMIVAKM